MRFKNIAKKLLSVLLVIILCIVTTPLDVLKVKSETIEFAGGSGTELDPYLISTKEHLNNVRNFLNAHYKMIADIEFTADDYSSTGILPDGWVPIGSSSKPFKGFFDGNNYNIIGLKKSETYYNAVYLGLFEHNEGTIINTNIVDCNFNAISTDSRDAYAGGIVAWNKGKIEHCSASGTIFATNVAGGLVGENYAGSITRSFNFCSVSSYRAGGIAGVNDRTVSNCFNAGNISGGIAGGIVGEGWLPSYSYNVGAIITNSGDSCGGIAGRFPPSYYSANDGNSCYYIDNVTYGIGYTSATDSTIRLSAEQMIKKESFDKFDFATTWEYDTNSNYPYPVLKKKLDYSSFFTGGDGSESNPFQISNIAELKNITKDNTAHYKLICDIVFTDNDYTEDGLFPSNWKPIEFKGVFDGQGYKISNLKIIVRNSLEYQWYNPGLFSLNDGTIKNLTIEKMQITVGQCGGRYGGFITAENNGVISNCHSKGCTIILENVSHYFGGIVGNNTGIIQKCTSDNIVNWNPIGGRIGGISANNSGSIRNCINKTTITNTSNSCFPISGGITAQNSGTISFSKNLSTISANSIESQITARCGGIAGEMTGGEIKQCYNSGNVNATATKYKSCTYSGGMVAYISGGKINDCYNIADIYGESKSSSASSYVGGLIGYNSTRGTIKNCYAVGNNSGKASSNNLYVGYICGFNSTNTIDNCYYLGIENNGSGFGDISTQYGNNSLNLQDKNTYSEFDFNKIWTITVDENYFYPQLKLLPMDYNNEDSTIIITGDINGDENINVVDIVRLKKFLADMDYCVSSSADLNDDGKINSLDLTILRSLILGINT